jgi:agmatine deiminase
MSGTVSKRLPAEWEAQDGVLLAWPHAATLWRPYLDVAQATIATIIAHISRHERVIVAAADPKATADALQRAGTNVDRVSCYAIPCNDIWARDFGPITVIEDGRPVLLDFVFNGWGGKYAADLDDQATRRLHEARALGPTPLRTVDFVLEGGGIETDGQGTILTTQSCLLNPNRASNRRAPGAEETLKLQLGAHRVLWLRHGCLAGDDTDGHVDMLARFAPDDTIVHVACDDPRDEHFAPLAAMIAELRAFRTPAGAPYRLIPLPWPSPKFDIAERRLPASYANFLVINGAVLVPTYRDPQDPRALDAVRSAFPGRTVIGVDASTLILQHGSLHCVTMQLPRGVLE